MSGCLKVVGAITLLLIGLVLVVGIASSPGVVPGGSPTPAGPTHSITVQRCVWFNPVGSLAPRAVNLVIENHRREQLRVDAGYFRVQAVNGRVYVAEFMPSQYESQLRNQYRSGALDTVTLSPGQSTEGWVLFSPPPDTTLRVLIYTQTSEEISLGECARPR